jgi:hypothetical protein
MMSEELKKLARFLGKAMGEQFKKRDAALAEMKTRLDAQTRRLVEQDKMLARQKKQIEELLVRTNGGKS